MKEFLISIQLAPKTTNFDIEFGSDYIVSITRLLLQQDGDPKLKIIS